MEQERSRIQETLKTSRVSPEVCLSQLVYANAEETRT
jgi:hypothetical protein